LASLVHAFLLFGILERKIGGFEKKEVFIPFLKIGIATFVTACFLWFPMRVLDKFILDTTRTINLIILTIIASFLGLGVYLFLSFLLKIEEFKIFVDLLKKIGQWRKILSESEEMIDSVRSPQG
jgi:peptidoglycan biosynthesis protein MviN/MurJ (putative lipid II flippase)